jgi:hypothetical protein
MLRAYYWCSHCRQGQFPADIARDIEDTEFSPGVRRMLALVVSECSSFDHGRQQMELLADLEVTAKTVERVTEAIGADIACLQQEIIQRTMQLELPVAVGEPIQKIYVQMDGTGLPMVAKETQGRGEKSADGRAHTREAKLGCVSRKPISITRGGPCVMKSPLPTPGPSKRPPNSPAGSTPKRTSAGGVGHTSRWSWVTAPTGFGISAKNSSPAPSRL